MTNLIRKCIPLAVALTFISFVLPASAVDFGAPKDVQQLRKVVSKKFGQVLHVSASHDWALCTAFSDESDLSVVLHRAEPDWKVVESDGGAYAAENLRKLGVPAAAIPALLKVYQ